MGRTFAAWPTGQNFSQGSIHDASAALSVARRFEDMLAKPPPGSPYEFGRLFSEDSWANRRRSRWRFRLLKAVDPLLAFVLVPGERVHFLTVGSMLSRAENFFTDWAARFLDLRALAFTDRRIILIQISRGRHPLGPVAHLPYAAIAEVEPASRGRSRLVLRDGSKMAINYTPRADRKFLREDMAGLVKAPPNARAAETVENLCPRCHAPVKGLPRRCPSCTIRLRRPYSSALFALLFPGLGHWRLGYRGFACFELAVATALWVMLVITPLTRQWGEGAPPWSRSTWLVVAGALAVVHLLDALMTLHYARRGLRAADG